MSLNFGQVPPLTMEIAAIERLKNRCLHFFLFVIDRILFKVGNYKIYRLIISCMRSKFWPDVTTDYGESAAIDRLRY